MNEQEKASSPVGVGVLTILTVLLVLALAVFSALTFSSARADLTLSKTNAETIAAYYVADAEARQQKDEFMAGDSEALEATIPMTDAQALYIHLRRELDGTCTVLAWKTVSNTTEEDTELAGDPLPVWDGTLPS